MFVKRVLAVILIGALTLALWRLSGLVILLFGAVLMAIGLRAAARLIDKATGAGAVVGLSLVVIVALASFAVVGWFFGSVIGNQVDELVRQVPVGLRQLSAGVEANPYARYVLEQARGMGASGVTGWAATALANLAGSLARGLASGVVMFLLAIYIAAQPQRYRQLVLRLVPGDYACRTEKLLDQSENVLRRWLGGQLVVMAAIGVLSGIGLWALGVDAALALGLASGLLCFVPYIGAIVAAIPAVLVALTQSPTQALLVIAMYAGVHFIEGNFISPLVQEEVTDLPPVLSLVSVIAVGALFGPSAALVAAPLTLFLMVATEVLYVEETLGKPSPRFGSAALPGADAEQVRRRAQS
jgi:predicted PurR-regulated permease PerM